MNRAEVADVLEKIDIYYPGRITVDDPKSRLDLWAASLAEYDVELVNKNLMAHVETSFYVPLIADLTKKQKAQGRAIPNHAETMAYLKAMDEREPAPEEVIQAEAAKVRAILGIKRAGDA